MRNLYTFYVGVDVAKSFYVVAILSIEGNEEKLRSFRVEANPRAFEKRLISIIGSCKRTDLLIIMESTGPYHVGLAEYLSRQGYKVVVANPFAVKRFIEANMSKAKTDKIDAEFLAKFGMHVSDHRLYELRSEEEKKVERYIKLIEDLKEKLVALENQREAARIILGKEDKDILGSYDRIIKELKKEIEAKERELKEYLKRSFAREYRLLLSIPGIREKAIGVILGVMRGFRGFKSVKEVVSYAGICPRVVESGSSVRQRGRMNRRGNRLVRRVFFMCALSAVRANRYCRELYERLLSRGKSKKAALVAVAAKLLRQAFGVLKSGRPFNAELATP